MSRPYVQTLPIAEVVSHSELITLAALAPRTASATGTAVFDMSIFRRLILVCDITASLTDAPDTLDAYVDVSLDNSIWLNAIHFTQQPGNGAPRREFAILDPAAPGAVVINATTDADAGVVRPAAWGPLRAGMLGHRGLGRCQLQPHVQHYRLRAGLIMPPTRPGFPTGIARGPLPPRPASTNILPAAASPARSRRHR